MDSRRNQLDDDLELALAPGQQDEHQDHDEDEHLVEDRQASTLRATTFTSFGAISEVPWLAWVLSILRRYRCHCSAGTAVT